MSHKLYFSPDRLPQIYRNETILQKAAGAFGKPYVLAHVAAAEEIAGSGTRQVSECYRVIFEIGGTRHSRAYKTREEAQREFDRVTMPIVGIPA